jgi:hypothetical protein
MLLNNVIALASEIFVDVANLSCTPGIVDPRRRNMNVWEDDAVRAAIVATGRRKLIFSGLLTEACVTFPVRRAGDVKADGFVRVINARCELAGQIDDPHGIRGPALRYERTSLTPQFVKRHIGQVDRRDKRIFLRDSRGHPDLLYATYYMRRGDLLYLQ